MTPSSCDYTPTTGAAQPEPGPFSVSVIIPAYNAAATLGTTLASLDAQHYPHWEAIVVDDGSTDGTADVAAQAAGRDPRVRLIQQPQLGIAAARNTGIAAARTDWLLFLDADDWIAPQHLERLTAALAADPTLDAVHCGWVRVLPDGSMGDVQFGPPASDLFPAFADHCALATVGVCLIRRSLVTAVGGFDRSFQNCVDWEFWLRVARAGARFGAVRERLTYYRLRPTSISIGMRNIALLHSNALRVLELAHGPDPRVASPAPPHTAGAPPELLARRRFLITCWCAGLAIGHGNDGVSLLAAIADREPALDPEAVATMLFAAAPLPRGLLQNAWPQLWSDLEPHLTAFLTALEARSGAPQLARRVVHLLASKAAAEAWQAAPATIGPFAIRPLELTCPLIDLLLPPGVEHLRCLLTVEGQLIGAAVLPVAGGQVTAAALAEATVNEAAWPILGRFFARTLYPQLHVKHEPDGVSLWRGKLALATGLPPEVASDPALAHDTIGWQLMLQEVWGRPDWPLARFYVPAPDDGRAAIFVPGRSLTVELSAEPPTLITNWAQLDVTLTAGGLAVTRTTVPVPQGRLSANALIAALTHAAGMDLCRAVVYQALIGRPLAAEPRGLRARLAAAARRTRLRAT